MGVVSIGKIQLTSRQVPKGSKITFTTESFGLGFFVGQRKVCYPLLIAGRLT
jgi:hypothetical protein